MSRLLNKPIEVQTDESGRPAAFLWRGRWKQVSRSITKESKPTSWTLFPEPETTRYQCETSQGMVCDLARIGKLWVLERIWD